jgi:hypothetical protein
MDEFLRDFAPPILGLLVAAAGLLYARYIRCQAARRRSCGAIAPRPAE